MDESTPQVSCSKDDVIAGLRSFKVGTACGRDGLRLRHILDTLGPPAHGIGSLVLDGLTSLLSVILRGEIPDAVRPYWVGGGITPSSNPKVVSALLWSRVSSGGLRPKLPSEVFYPMWVLISVPCKLGLVLEGVRRL